jgi:hypothetical protein
LAGLKPTTWWPQGKYVSQDYYNAGVPGIEKYEALWQATVPKQNPAANLVPIVKPYHNDAALFTAQVRYSELC